MHIYMRTRAGRRAPLAAHGASNSTAPELSSFIKNHEFLPTRNPGCSASGSRG